MAALVGILTGVASVRLREGVLIFFSFSTVYWYFDCEKMEKAQFCIVSLHLHHVEEEEDDEDLL